MYFDGALNLEGAGPGVLLISPRANQLKYVLQIHYTASNNGAEYEALIHGLRIAISLGIRRLMCYGDSSVVINQVNKEWDTRKETMDAYCAEIHKLEAQFYSLEIQFVPRERNVAADVLSKLGSKRAMVPAGVFVQDLRKPSIKILEKVGDPPIEAADADPPARNELMIIEGDWRAPILAFILEQKSYPDRKQHEKLVR